MAVYTQLQVDVSRYVRWGGAGVKKGGGTPACLPPDFIGELIFCAFRSGFSPFNSTIWAIGELKKNSVN